MYSGESLKRRRGSRKLSQRDEAENRSRGKMREKGNVREIPSLRRNLRATISFNDGGGVHELDVASTWHKELSCLTYSALKQIILLSYVF